MVYWRELSNMFLDGLKLNLAFAFAIFACASRETRVQVLMSYSMILNEERCFLNDSL